ncbi:HAD superfamily hydrolase (TIGR01509 family) [Sphingomonas zeicaulis]|uniref:HAD family hydrolase n=1 Tax=Sphingomonas zeicaulis TaxID=1632740 RepID=UPI003D19493B
MIRQPTLTHENQRRFQPVPSTCQSSASREIIHDQIGKGADMLVPALLPDLDPAARDSLAEAHGAAFKAKYLGKARPFPSAHALLAAAHDRGQQVVLASSASQAELDHYLDLLEARALVGATTSSDDVRHTKPAPDLFAVALGKLQGIDAEAAIVVGDTPYDMQAANGCGIAAVAVRSGKFRDDVLWNAGAIAIYDDAAALLAAYASSPLGR